MTRVDFSDSEGYPLIDQGLHTVTVTGMEIKASQTTGNEYYEFEFTIASGEFQGSKLWLRNMINAKDRNRYLRETLEGIMGNDIPLEAVEVYPNDYIGRGCQVQVIHDEYQGKVRPQVAGVHSAKFDIGAPGPSEIIEDPPQDVPW